MGTDLAIQLFRYQRMDPMPFGGMSVAEKINSFVNTKNGCGHEHQICFYIVTNKSFLLTICNFV